MKMLVWVALLSIAMTAAAHAVEPVESEPLPGANILVTGEEPNTIIPMQPTEPSAPSVQPENANPATVDTICQSIKTLGAVSGPAYVEGMDAYGRPVAPANLSQSSAIDVPERIDIPVAINVAQSMNLAPATEMSAVPGTVTVFKDGRVLYNGQDVSGPVSAYCNQLKPELNVNVQ